MESIPDASRRIRELTSQIQVEKDPQKFSALIEELNRLLDGVPPPEPPSPSKNHSQK